MHARSHKTKSRASLLHCPQFLIVLVDCSGNRKRMNNKGHGSIVSQRLHNSGKNLRWQLLLNLLFGAKENDRGEKDSSMPPFVCLGRGLGWWAVCVVEEREEGIALSTSWSSGGLHMSGDHNTTQMSVEIHATGPRVKKTALKDRVEGVEMGWHALFWSALG